MRKMQSEMPPLPRFETTRVNGHGLIQKKPRGMKKPRGFFIYYSITYCLSGGNPLNSIAL